MSEPIIIAIIAAVAGLVALKLTVSFDLNQHLADRRERKNQGLMARIQGTCPHVEVVEVSGDFGIKHTFDGAPFHTPWVCKVCGYKVATSGAVDDNSQLWADADAIPRIIERQQKVQDLLNERYGV